MAYDMGVHMQQECSRHDVIHELETVLADAKFAAAPQMSAFLKFVVTQTLDGNADRIKAYTVAVDALGKPATFDPQNDPSVRVLAKRLRDTLTAYYDRTSGHSVILRLRSGSYIPKFEKTDQAQNVVNTSNVTPLNRASNNELSVSSEPSASGMTSGTSIFNTNKIAKP